MKSNLILIKKLFTLSSFGINQTSYTLQNISLQSDKYTLVRDSVDGRGHIHIFSNAKPQDKFRAEFIMESAHICFDQLIIALKSEKNIQIYNLETKQLLRSFDSPEEIEFFCWLTKEILGVVSATTVYQINYKSETQLRKIFSRNTELCASNFTVLSYIVDNDNIYHFYLS